MEKSSAGPRESSAKSELLARAELLAPNTDLYKKDKEVAKLGLKSAELRKVVALQMLQPPVDETLLHEAPDLRGLQKREDKKPTDAEVTYLAEVIDHKRKAFAAQIGYNEELEKNKGVTGWIWDKLKAAGRTTWKGIEATGGFLKRNWKWIALAAAAAGLGWYFYGDLIRGWMQMAAGRVSEREAEKAVARAIEAAPVVTPSVEAPAGPGVYTWMKNLLSPYAQLLDPINPGATAAGTQAPIIPKGRMIGAGGAVFGGTPGAK